MTLLTALIYMLVGFVLLIWSADRLVAGASALARQFGISVLIVGITIVGFGTSAPEMFVSALASLQGNPSLAIGNAIGSNIANIALILGLTGLVYPMSVDRSTCTREIPLLGVVTIIIALMMADAQLTRFEGVLLALGLALFIGGMVFRARHGGGIDPGTAALIHEIAPTMSKSRAIGWTALGLIVLPISAHLLVQGGVSLASMMGVSEAVIGLTIVALGTSLPELAAAIASAVRREDDLCIGNILGSNLFNLLGVLGIAALIHPMEIERMLIVRDLPVMALTLVMLAAMAMIARRIGRLNALLLLITYLIYQVAVIHQALG